MIDMPRKQRCLGKRAILACMYATAPCGSDDSPPPTPRDTAREQSAMAAAQTRTDTTSEPRFEQGTDGPVLILPRHMRLTLKEAAPHFRWLEWSAFQKEIRQAEAPTAHSALFAVIADFNGDGRLDVAMAGNDSTHGRLVALMTNADTVALVRILDLPLPLPEERRAMSMFLQYVPAGMITADTVDEDRLSPPQESSYERVPVRLERDAFELVFWQRASTLYYWRNGRFVEWTTSD